MNNSCLPPHGPNRQRGFSLVELMIAAALGLLLIAVIGSVYLAGRQSFQDQDEASRLQENGRFMLDVIARVVHETGRTDYGPGNTVGIPPLYVPGAVEFPVIPAGAVALDASNGPDTLTVRFVSATQGEQDCLGNGTTGNVGAPVLVTQILALNGTDLRCTSTVGGGAPQIQPLASEIEDFQIQLGVDANNDGFVDTYLAPDTANAAISRSVRVCILARTADGVAPAPQQYVDCNGVAVNAGDRRIRRAFTRTIGLRNRLG